MVVVKYEKGISGFLAKYYLVMQVMTGQTLTALELRVLVEFTKSLLTRYLASSPSDYHKATINLLSGANKRTLIRSLGYQNNPNAFDQIILHLKNKGYLERTEDERGSYGIPENLRPWTFVRGEKKIDFNVNLNIRFEVEK